MRAAIANQIIICSRKGTAERYSFRLRRVCSSGGIPIVSLSVYSLTSQQYIRFKDPVSDASKMLNPPPKTDAAPRSSDPRCRKSTQNRLLPVEFLDHEALADAAAAACLRRIPARRRASPIRILPVRLNSLAPLAIALSHPWYACQIIIPTLSQRAHAGSLVRPAIDRP